MQHSNRRQFLRTTSALVGTTAASAWMGNLATLGQAAAQAASTTDYKALVCIYLGGGNDAHNTVVPTDPQSWRCYSATRDPAVMAQLTDTPVPTGITSIALDQAALLNINHLDAKGLNTGRTFGLHPQLKQIQQLYNQGNAAIVANIGPLIQPTSKADLIDSTYPVPAKLYSHNDQTATWQSFGLEGATVGGWGGRLMDSLVSRNANPTFSCVGVNAQAVWLSGAQTSPYLLGTGGFHVMGGSDGNIMGSSALFKAVRTVASQSTRGDTLAQDYMRTVNRALDSEAALTSGLPNAAQAPWGTPGTTAGTDPLLQYTDPNDGLRYFNPLAQQLQVVARMIAARNQGPIGARRQVFMVNLGGFDTHSDLLKQHGSLMAKLDHAVAYFMRCLSQMPGGDVRSQVTSFTASEFGRGLANNGDGADHGWGGHHFVIGGSVKGGDIYGMFPKFMAFDGDGGFFSDQLLQRGVLLPTLSVDHLVYTLGKWMGVPEVDLVGRTPGTGIAPNITNFDQTEWDLGCMA